MIRKLVIGATAAAVMVTPAAALAAKGPHYKAGQKCTAKKAALYKAQHFTCAKGKLVAMKK
jgi:hypothetical protein